MIYRIVKKVQIYRPYHNLGKTEDMLELYLTNWF